MEPKKKKILIIDDDEKFLFSFYKALIDRGHYVVMQRGAAAAADWALHKDVGNFDMIISDQRMPGEEGTSFISFLNELEKVDPEKIDLTAPTSQNLRKRFSHFSDIEFRDFLKGMRVHSGIRVILSGYAKDDSIEKALAARKVDFFLSKETPIPEILDSIDRLFKEVNKNDGARSRS